MTLAEKIQVIDTVNNGKSHCSVALLFGVGHTQVNTIIGQKEAIKTAYQEGMNVSIKYLAHRNMQYPEIDNDVWSFFCEARSKCIPINGPMLQSKAHESALHHNYNFIASNGLSLFVIDIKLGLQYCMVRVLKYVKMSWNSGCKTSPTSQKIMN